MDQKCRLDGSELIEVVNLGNQYFTDFVDDPTDGIKCPLRMGIGKDSGMVQMFETLNPESMYRKYWYRSGINERMVRDLKNVVESASNFVDVKEGDTVLDIACNDGTLLGFWPKEGVTRIGIDPARNLSKFREGKVDKVVEDFYSLDNFNSVSQDRAKVITSIAMFYDLPDPHWFVDQVKSALADDGVWIIQMSYMPLMLQQNAFDNICHEHIEYYSLSVLNKLFNEHGLKVMDAEFNDVNSGSIRLYVSHAKNKKFKLPYHALQIGEFKVNSILKYEESLDLLSPKPYHEFFQRVEKNKVETMELLKKLKSEGKKVMGYGASTKGNVLLQYYGITPDLISHIAERTPEKWEKVTVGTGIPIISEEEMREMNPDYLFIFPWHFVEPFMERESKLREGGTKFIVPLPNLIIL